MRGTISQQAAVVSALTRIKGLNPSQSYKRPPTKADPAVPRLAMDIRAAKKVPSALSGQDRAARP